MNKMYYVSLPACVAWCAKWLLKDRNIAEYEYINTHESDPLFGPEWGDEPVQAPEHVTKITGFKQGNFEQDSEYSSAKESVIIGANKEIMDEIIPILIEDWFTVYRDHCDYRNDDIGYLVDEGIIKREIEKVGENSRIISYSLTP